MKRIIVSLAVFGVFLSGCVREEISDNRPADYVKSDRPVKLLASYDRLTATVATDTRVPYMGEIGDNGTFETRVFASLHATSFQNEISLGRTMTFTAQGAAQATSVGYSSPLYYPVDGSQVRLNGFYPHTAWQLVTSGGYDTFKATIDGKSDLMASKPVSTTIDDALVLPTTYKNLNFSHALTLLDLKIKAKDAATIAVWGDITSVKVTGVVYNTTNALPSTTVQWNATNETYTYTDPVQSGEGIPFYVYSTGYTDNVISATNKQALTETITQVGYIMVPPVQVDKTGAVQFGYQLSIETSTGKTATLTVPLTLTDPNAFAGTDTRGKSFPVELTFDQQAVSTIYEIPIPAEFFGTASELSLLKTTRTYIVYDPVDLTGNKRLAEIDLEYIRGFSETIPAVVVYEMEYSDSYPNGRRKANGVIANNGNHVNWSGITKDHLVSGGFGDETVGGNYSSLYSTGSPIDPFTEFYYIPGTGIQYSDPNPGASKIELDPLAYNFKDWENTLYPVVKIGTQYYMSSNLRAASYPNGTSINDDYCPLFCEIYGYIYSYKNMDIDNDPSNDIKDFGRYYSETLLPDFTPYQGWKRISREDNAVFMGYLTKNEGGTKVIYPAISDYVMVDFTSPSPPLPLLTNVSGFSMMWTARLHDYAGYRPDIGGYLGGGDVPTWWIGFNGTEPYAAFSYVDGNFLAWPYWDQDWEEEWYYAPIRLVVNDYLP